jgi:hypothetical protein
VTDPATLFEFLTAQIADAETNWSLGTFGAIAEFTRDPGEPVAFTRSATSLSAVTPRGGLRLERVADMRLVASETATGKSWNHRIALCLPEARCAMSRRAVLTELGPDAEALREQDRGAILFDLGLDALQADFCIRVPDTDVAAQLRTHAGRAVFEPGNPAMSLILASSPHRVFVSRLGRIEVLQSIPSPDGTSPESPHTHVLPKLLRLQRTHAATEPIPDGFVPCAHLYPAHPAKDAFGHRRPFDPARHDAFQKMLRMFGNPELVVVKEKVAAAIAAGQGPSAVVLADNRFSRINVRVALRQLRMSHEASPSLTAWVAAHEQAGQIATNEDPHGHQ